MWPPLTMSSWLVLGLKVSSRSGGSCHLASTRFWRKSLWQWEIFQPVNNLRGKTMSLEKIGNLGVTGRRAETLSVWGVNWINLIVRTCSLLSWKQKSERRRKKTSMCLSWRGAPEVLTNLQWPVYALPPLIAPCISVWCECSHCSERPVSPQRSHTFIITLYCRTLYGHSAPNSLPVKNRAFSSPLLLVVSVLITNTEPKPESSAGLPFFLFFFFFFVR